MIQIDEAIMCAYRREMEKFMNIRESVAECAKRAAPESPFPNITEMLAELQKKHGKRRVATFFANVVNGAPWDGRYTAQTKEWAAKQRPIPENPYSVNFPDRLRKPPGEFYTDMHPIIVDGFVKHIIQNERDARAKRRSGPVR